MRRLLALAALIVALWVIDSYAFRGRYHAAIVEDINDYAQKFNGAMQRFAKHFGP